MKTRGNADKIGAWTESENYIICDAYLIMLTKETRGEKYNKSAARRTGLAAMSATRDDKRARSPGSWEMKACNVSAVLAAAGLPYIKGYKPLGHGQARPLAVALAAMMIAHGYDDDDINAVEALT